MNLLKALADISSMTLVSPDSGIRARCRDCRAFGAGLYTDAFFVAFRLPNLLRRLCEGAFAQAFVPILGEYRKTRTPDENPLAHRPCRNFAGHGLIVRFRLGMIAAPLII